MEISEWIQQEKNAQEVMILYIEDHSEAHHEELYQLLGETHLLERIFPSGGCIAIPDDLTKADVLAAGKQIILWKDELRLGQKNIPCGDNKNIAELAFNDLGNLKRKAEDRTFLGSIDKRLRHGTWPRILLDDVKPHLLDGVNIMNLDEFVQNDERLYEFLWTWSLDADINLENACTIMQSGGSWLFRDCNERHHAACVNTTFTEWKVSQEAMTFDQASKSCESESADVRFHFSAPTNFSENLNLLHTMEARKYNRLWLNIRYTDNDVQVGDKRSENSITGN